LVPIICGFVHVLLLQAVGGNVRGLIVFMGLVEMVFQGGMTDEPLGTQGTLVIVWKAYVEGSQDWVVRPISAIVARESVTRSCGHALRSWDESVLIDDVILGLASPNGMASEGGLIGELPVTQGALMDVWQVCLCMEGPQDGIV
jgi:hypothetical protein